MGLNLGVDFKGGTVINLQTDKNITEVMAQRDIDKLGFDMYSFEKEADDTYSIKIDNSLSQKKAMSTEKYFANKYDAATDVGVISNVVKADELNSIVNESLREILNRSIVTTMTTLIPVVCLILLGAHDIFEFNIALLFGLVIGTLCSIFVASQIWLEIEKKNIKEGKTKKKKKKIVLEDEVDELQIKGINS